MDKDTHFLIQSLRSLGHEADEALDFFKNQLRIRTCYIRDVRGAARDNAVQSIISTLAQLGVDMPLVPDTLAASVHANSKGWLPLESLKTVQAAVDVDRQGTV